MVDFAWSSVMRSIGVRLADLDAMERLVVDNWYIGNFLGHMFVKEFWTVVSISVYVLHVTVTDQEGLDL